MQLDGGDFHLEESSMGDDWKEKLDDILYENKLNQAPRNDVCSLSSHTPHNVHLLDGDAAYFHGESTDTAVEIHTAKESPHTESMMF